MIILCFEAVQFQEIARDSVGHSWGTRRQKAAIFGNKWQYKENAKALISLLLRVVMCWIPLPSNPRVGGSSPSGGYLQCVEKKKIATLCVALNFHEKQFLALFLYCLNKGTRAIFPLPPFGNCGDNTLHD